MSRIINVIANDDYTLQVEFENGSKILFNMQDLVKTIPYARLQELEYFRRVEFDEKALFWRETNNRESAMLPIRLTVDNMLFSIRD